MRQSCRTVPVSLLSSSAVSAARLDFLPVAKSRFDVSFVLSGWSAVFGFFRLGFRGFRAEVTLGAYICIYIYVHIYIYIYSRLCPETLF